MSQMMRIRFRTRDFGSGVDGTTLRMAQTSDLILEDMDSGKRLHVKSLSFAADASSRLLEAHVVLLLSDVSLENIEASVVTETKLSVVPIEKPDEKSDR